MTVKTKFLGTLLATTFLTAPTWADYAPTLGNNSIYTVTAGSANDYNFKTTDGETTSYYKINLNTQKLGTSNNISWSENSGGMYKVRLPNGKETYLDYTYTQPSGYTQSDVLNSPAENINNKIFSNISVSGNNAVVNNQNNGNVINIQADFLDNTSEGSWHDTHVGNTYIRTYYGGALNNTNSSINNISGSFINNQNGQAGSAVVNNKEAQINNLIADFIGNNINGQSYTVYGGVIENGGNISKIKGNFIGNYVWNYVGLGTSLGGAINNRGTIGEIEGNFIGNYTYSVGSYNSAGGAIYNYGTIDSIKGDFIDNRTTAAYRENNDGGGILNGGTIRNFSGDFINNRAGKYGGALENAGIFENINANFINNYSDFMGGAIYNVGHMEKITGSFIGNHVSGIAKDAEELFDRWTFTSYDEFAQNYNFENMQALLDMYNLSSTEELIYVFQSEAQGGAIANGGEYFGYSGSIGDIYADFIGNYAVGTHANGGAIQNRYSSIENIVGNFVDNYAYSKTNDYMEHDAPDETMCGGAIFNYSASIGNITGDFIRNYYQADEVQAYGGAIYNDDSTIGTITGHFSENYSYAKTKGSEGGAIYNNGTIEKITVDFTDNYAKGKIWANGGAVYNASAGSVSFVNANFKGNYVSAEKDEFVSSTQKLLIESGYASVEEMAEDMGYSSVEDMIGERGYDSTDEMAAVEYGLVGSQSVAGGAIYNRGGTVSIAATDGETSLISGNYVQSDDGKKEYQAIYMDGGELILSAREGGKIIIDDKIEGNDYTISVSLDDSEDSYIKFNNIVEGAKELVMAQDTILHLGINSDVKTEDMISRTEAVMSPSAVSTPTIKVDVKVRDDKTGFDAGTIHVSGDVQGQYSIIVNALTPDVLEDLEAAKTPFLFAPNDDQTTASNFSVARVIGSPYMWDGAINAKGETEGSTWYLNLTEEENPDYEEENPVDTEEPVNPDDPVDPDDPVNPDQPDIRHMILAPEVLSSIGLQSVSMQQTSGMVRNIRNKIAGNWTRNPEALNNVWVLTEGENSETKAPANVDAKVWSVDAGFDVQNDENNTIGLFTSYRKGDYDVKANGGEYRSTGGSEIDVDSWLAGLYYRYDRDDNWLFATVYGGKQDVKTNTKDGIAKYNTDGLEMGASIEGGHYFAINSKLGVEPSLGIYYTHISLDDTTDNVGKSYEWKDLRHVEVEAGAKLSRRFTNAEVYVKPSLVRTFTSGDEVKVTGLESISTYKDALLTRVEVGTRFGITDKLSGYAWGNYTTGSDYEATSGGLGISYAW